jgi:eukaryotic-like serine/threonine-protein kinase
MDLRQRVQDSLSGTHTIERALGGGGMSRVFVASEHRLGRKVVVKVLAPDLAAAISAERFEREIRLDTAGARATVAAAVRKGYDAYVRNHLVHRHWLRAAHRGVQGQDVS